MVINQFMENLFLCITDGYYSIFFWKTLFDTANIFDIDNLCGPQSTYSTKEIQKKKKKKNLPNNY
jgi:hypothetical protein